jgi:hypothetical protein
MPNACCLIAFLPDLLAKGTGAIAFLSGSFKKNIYWPSMWWMAEGEAREENEVDVLPKP